MLIELVRKFKEYPSVAKYALLIFNNFNIQARHSLIKPHKLLAGGELAFNLRRYNHNIHNGLSAANRKSCPPPAGVKFQLAKVDTAWMAYLTSWRGREESRPNNPDGYSDLSDTCIGGGAEGVELGTHGVRNLHGNDKLGYRL